MSERILIVDFGSQFTQLIARRVRESGVYSEIVPYDKVAPALDGAAPAAVILSGGPASVLAKGAPRADPRIFEIGVPVLGICYGQQAMCAELGGRVEVGDRSEFGRATLDVVGRCDLFHDLWPPGRQPQVWMSHGDRVTAIPEGFDVAAVSEGAPFAAIADDRRRLYGVMFHPEVVHTPEGAALLRNFTHRIAGCAGEWTMAAFREAATAEARARIGDGTVICALSGGVDSAVVAVLLHQAIGERLTCVFVDTGLLRAGEADGVIATFRERYNMKLVHRDAASMFLERLRGVSDPEDKRKIIGAAFIDVFDEEAGKLGGVDFLAQGTLYPDVIESVSASGGPSATIKSHHNVGGLPERMNLALVEPLRSLFKDEVRVLGRELGMPHEIVGRHPFPGPGLAVRMLGPVTAEKVALLRRADAIFIDEIRAAGLYDSIWQALAVLVGAKSVGVMGDERSYEDVVALRAVTSLDGMTADVFAFPPDFLGRVATRIINEVRGINRVVYDVTSKPPGTIEWE